MALEPVEEKKPAVLASARKVDITPDMSLGLAGNGNQEFGVDVGEPLEANLAAFVIGRQKFLWIAVDALYVGDFFISKVRNLIGEMPGWTVSFFATHSHNAPALDLTKPLLGKASKNWVSRVAQLVASEVFNLMSVDFADSTGRATAFDLSGGISRRVLKPVSISRRGLHFWKAVSGVNSEAQIDARCNVFVLADSRSLRPIFAVINWPCHPVGEPKGFGYSPSFPGAMRSAIADFLGSADLPILFLQGFSSEIRPDAPETNIPRRTGLLAQVFGPGYSNFSTEGLRKWREDLVTRFCESLRKASWNRLSFDQLYVRETQLDLGQIFPGITPRPFATVLRIRLSARLVVLAISGEVPSSCSLRLRAILGEETIAIAAGCSGDTVGYLPTARFRREKGYEGFTFTSVFGLPKVSNNSGEYLDQLVEEAGFELKGSVT